MALHLGTALGSRKRNEEPSDPRKKQFRTAQLLALRTQSGAGQVGRHPATGCPQRPCSSAVDTLCGKLHAAAAEKREQAADPAAEARRCAMACRAAYAEHAADQRAAVDARRDACGGTHSDDVLSADRADFAMLLWLAVEQCVLAAPGKGTEGVARVRSELHRRSVAPAVRVVGGKCLDFLRYLGTGHQDEPGEPLVHVMSLWMYLHDHSRLSNVPRARTSHLTNVSDHFLEWVHGFGRDTFMAVLRALLLQGNVLQARQLLGVLGSCMDLCPEGGVDSEKRTLRLLCGLLESHKCYPAFEGSSARLSTMQWIRDVRQLADSCVDPPATMDRDEQTRGEVIRGMLSETAALLALDAKQLESLRTSGPFWWLDVLCASLLYQHDPMDWSARGAPSVKSVLKDVFDTPRLAPDGALDCMGNDEKCLFSLLSDQFDVLAEWASAIGVPGVAAHLVEVLVPPEQQQQRAKFLAEHAAALGHGAPGLWREALDYAAWAGCEEGLSAACCIAAQVGADPELGGDRLDWLMRWAGEHYPGSEPLSGILLAAHQGQAVALLQQMDTVEGFRRLVQAQDLDGACDHMEHLLVMWGDRVVRSLADAPAGGCGGAEAWRAVCIAARWDPITTLSAALADAATAPIPASVEHWGLRSLLATVGRLGHFVSHLGVPAAQDSVRGDLLFLAGRGAAPLRLRIAVLLLARLLLARGPGLCISPDECSALCRHLDQVLRHGRREGAALAGVTEDAPAAWADVSGLRNAIRAALPAALVAPHGPDR
eukprot:TRINITY_DN21060_c0_g1_i2.p1 TRINITY_DN21060_c0_g1~~TRINITY_DN21060_c0_g1_i2.p1  ORF type:complete len:795 (+),score=166.64 TRINITY_DN21060_c0_g1_i2:81-2387(+)